MSVLENAAVSVLREGDDDRDAISDLRRAFDAQRRAFAQDRTPSLEVRRERVARIAPMMLSARERIADALATDFGAHPRPAADLLEVLAVVGRVQYVLENLESWMARESRPMDAGLFGSARAYMEQRPKGVVGNIIPWNFPFDIGVGPAVEMLAAGNRVILKPSEYTPRCAALLAEMVASHFEPELMTVAVGGLALARAFGDLAWDHLMYTGSPGVGRQVMAAAARNLTPVTLELGGKCPAVIVPGGVDAESVKTVVGVKMIKNGQMCVSVDYVFVPRSEMESFVELAESFVAGAAPGYADGAECTGIVSLGHIARLERLLQEARDADRRIVTLGGPDAPADRVTRRMAMRLVLDPGPELGIMQEEIFGPILPVVPYDDLQNALDLINRGERPLGVYVLGHDRAQLDRVLAQTSSGGAAINTCALQAALPSLGFGGSGMSGMGRHHGIEGFREFSVARGVVERGEADQIDAFFAPYAKAEAIVAHVLTAGARPA